MQSNRPIVVGFIVAALAAAGLWFFLQGGEGPTAPPAPDRTTPPVASAAPGAPVDSGSKPESAVVTTENAERTAVAPGRGVDERLPGFTGRVVGPDGRPIAGARVGVAPGFGPANGNGRFDLQSFDFAALEDGALDPAAMLRAVRDQQKERVEVETDAEGHFRIVAKGSSPAVGLRVLARGHGILDRRFDRPRDQDLDVGTLALQAAAIVAGRVLTVDGTPVVGARVGRALEMEQRLLGGIEFEIPELAEIETLRGGDAVLTDELGQFELAHVAPGELTLRARHPEHPTARSKALTVEAGRELRAVLLTMQNGGVIAGVVSGLPADRQGLQVMAARKPKTDAPEPGGARGIAGLIGNLGVDLDAIMGEAGIGLGERSATIGVDGRFEVRGLAADTWRVWVARTGSGLAGSTTCSERVEAVPGSTVELVFVPGVTVTFTVADSKSGKPVERLVVRDQLRGPGGGGVADLLGGMAAMGGLQSRRPADYPNGAVTVANLRPKADQKLTLTIEAVGYATLERGNLELPATGNLDLGALALEPVPVLTVTVVTSDDGRPVAGANVRLVGGGDGDRGGAGRRGIPREFRRFVPGVAGAGIAGGRTDRDGRITKNRPPQGAVIEVDAQGFAPFASSALTFTAAGPDSYTAKLHVGGAIAATVCDPADKPVAGAFVEHRSPDGDVDSRKTDDQGLARFEHLAPGAHQFRLGKEGAGLGGLMSRLGGRAGATNAAPAAAELPWTSVEVADQALAAVRLVQQPTATLRGIVRENGLPLADARVAFREGPEAAADDPQAAAFGDLAERFAGGGRAGAGRTPRTDAQGAYELRELPEGEHHLRISHGSRSAPTTVRIVLRAGDNVVDVDLDTTMLRGVVKDTAGQPVAGARIRVRRPRDGSDPTNEISGLVENFAGGRAGGAGPGTIQTDAAGAFEVRGVEPDVELEVSASAKGFASAAQRVTAARGAATTAPALVLGAAGTVRVSVAGNQPFGTVRARWVGQGDGVAPVVGVLRRGKGTLEGLRPGTWEITVESLEALGGRLGGRFGGRSGAGPGGQPQQPAQPQPQRTVEVVAGQTVDVDL